MVQVADGDGVGFFEAGNDGGVTAGDEDNVTAALAIFMAMLQPFSFRAFS